MEGKKISRTLITNYVYDVMSREGDTLTKVGTVKSPTALRSVKQQSAEIKKAKFDDSKCVLIYNTVEQSKYEMSETDFLQYATKVTPQETK